MVALTEAGETAFVRLRDTAIAFDAKPAANYPPFTYKIDVHPGAGLRGNVLTW